CSAGLRHALSTAAGVDRCTALGSTLLLALLTAALLTLALLALLPLLSLALLSLLPLLSLALLSLLTLLSLALLAGLTLLSLSLLPFRPLLPVTLLQRLQPPHERPRAVQRRRRVASLRSHRLTLRLLHLLSNPRDVLGDHFLERRGTPAVEHSESIGRVPELVRNTIIPDRVGCGLRRSCGLGLIRTALS